MVNFSDINRALAKLERKELEAEALLESSLSKLKRLRRQKQFLREQEQKMFDRGLDDVEELERLEELEKSSEVERAVTGAPTLDEFFSSRALSPGTLSWLDQTLPVGPVIKSAAASSGSL